MMMVGVMHGIDHSSVIRPEYTALSTSILFLLGEVVAGRHTLFSLLTASEHGVLGITQYYGSYWMLN